MRLRRRRYHHRQRSGQSGDLGRQALVTGKGEAYLWVQLAVEWSTPPPAT